MPGTAYLHAPAGNMLFKLELQVYFLLDFGLQQPMTIAQDLAFRRFHRMPELQAEAFLPCCDSSTQIAPHKTT